MRLRKHREMLSDAASRVTRARTCTSPLSEESPYDRPSQPCPQHPVLDPSRRLARHQSPSAPGSLVTTPRHRCRPRLTARHRDHRSTCTSARSSAIVGGILIATGLLGLALALVLGVRPLARSRRPTVEIIEALDWSDDESVAEARSRQPPSRPSRQSSPRSSPSPRRTQRDPRPIDRRGVVAADHPERAGAECSRPSARPRVRARYWLNGPGRTITWIVLFVIATVAVTGVVGRLGWSARGTGDRGRRGVVHSGRARRSRSSPSSSSTASCRRCCSQRPSARRSSMSAARRDSILLLSVGLVAFTVVTVRVRRFRADPVDHTRGRVRARRRDRPDRCDRGHGDRRAARTAASRRDDPRGREPAERRDGARGPQRVDRRDRQRRHRRPRSALDFVVAVLVGTGVGLLTGFVVSWVRSRLHSAVLDTSLTLVTPFAAFLLAQAAARLRAYSRS